MMRHTRWWWVVAHPLLAVTHAKTNRKAVAVNPVGRIRVAMTTELADAIEAGWDKADRENLGPTVDYFHDLLQRFPENRYALYEYGGALDSAGREAEAVVFYERAFAAGLDGDTLRKGLIQYGSTLRNLGRYEEAVTALSRARHTFPDSDSVRMFLALTLVSAGRGNEAVAELINLALDRLDGDDARRYQRSLRGYAAQLVEPGHRNS
jgi:tetratricopeptide (TPR) repeat protein